MNCYEIFGESDMKTEGILRARFEQAISCSPCVLVIRHVDAFVQSTQPIEPGKGEYISSFQMISTNLIVQSLV